MTKNPFPRPGTQATAVEIKEEHPSGAEYVCVHCSGTGYTTTKQAPLVVAPKKPSAIATWWSKEAWPSIKAGAKWVWGTLGGILVIGGTLLTINWAMARDNGSEQFKEDIASCAPFLKSSDWSKGNCNCLEQKELLNPLAKPRYDEAEAKFCEGIP